MKILLRTSMGHNVIGSLFRKELYREVHHRIGYTSEDYYIFPRLVEHADRIVVENNGTYHYRELRPGSVTAEGRNSFPGFYPRSVHRFDRYARYKDAYPEECRIVLKELVHFTNPACLYAGDDPRSGECREILAREEKEIMASGDVSRYEKWLTKEILRSGKVLPAIRFVHHTSHRMKFFAGDIVKGRKLRFFLFKIENAKRVGAKR